MAGKVNDLKISIWLLVGLILGCEGFGQGRKALVVFIDYTTSASTFENGNLAEIETVVQELAVEMGREDILEVYPIHAFTESATPILRLSGPELMGDLNDGMRQREWMERALGAAVEKITTVQFSRNRTIQTNIYPVTHKISRLVEAGYGVSAVLVCDLIQNHDGENFAQVFGESDANPAALAGRQVVELGFEEALRGVDVSVMIPGSPQGSHDYDRIRAQVNAFWVEFFTLCGADLVIRDL